MEIRNGKYGQQRRAISPIIATVLIIAVTLIAAVAIGGFVFGIFGSASATAQITVVTVIAPAAGFKVGAGSTALTCGTAPLASLPGAYLVLTNTGTAAATVTGVTLTWAGQGNAFTTPSTCAVGAAGASTATTYLNFATPATGATLLTAAVTGQTFSGYATLSNGAEVLFTGTFQ